MTVVEAMKRISLHSQYGAYDTFNPNHYDDDDAYEHFKVVQEMRERENETPENLVIRLLKGGFEETHGITFEEFIETYNKILENNPEKLI